MEERTLEMFMVHSLKAVIEVKYEIPNEECLRSSNMLMSLRKRQFLTRYPVNNIIRIKFCLKTLIGRKKIGNERVKACVQYSLFIMTGFNVMPYAELTD